MKCDTNVGLGLALSFLGGFSLGLLGIGGGAVVVPILNLVMNFPIHLAVATSIFNDLHLHVWSYNALLNYWSSAWSPHF